MVYTECIWLAWFEAVSVMLFLWVVWSSCWPRDLPRDLVGTATAIVVLGEEVVVGAAVVVVIVRAGVVVDVDGTGFVVVVIGAGVVVVVVGAGVVVVVVGSGVVVVV